MKKPVSKVIQTPPISIDLENTVQGAREHIQDAKTVAAEDTASLASEYPNATVWRTEVSAGPGRGFRLLGSIDGTTFNDTIAQPHSPKSLHQSPADVLRHVAAQARQNAADKPVPPPMKIHQLVKKVIPPRRSFAPPAPRPVLPGNWSAAKLSALGEDPVAVPFLVHNKMRGSAVRRGVAYEAASAGGQAIGLRAEIAAFGRQVMGGWRREVAVMRASAPWLGAGHAPASRAGTALEAAISGRVNGASLSGGVIAMRRLRAASGAAGVPKRGGAQPDVEMLSFAPRKRRVGAQAAADNRQGVAAMGGPPTGTATLMRNPPHAPVKARFAAAALSAEAASSTLPSGPSGTVNQLREADLAEALRAYFFRQSRMPPSSMTGFDPRVSPAWAGLQMPG